MRAQCVRACSQHDHEEVVDRALDEFNSPDYDGKKPGKRYTNMSDFYPPIHRVEPLASYALGECGDVDCPVRVALT